MIASVYRRRIQSTPFRDYDQDEVSGRDWGMPSDRFDGIIPAAYMADFLLKCDELSFTDDVDFFKPFGQHDDTFYGNEMLMYAFN